MNYLWLCVLATALFVFKRGWRQITVADFAGIFYVCCLATIIVAQHYHIVELECKVQESAKAAIEQDQAIRKLSVMVYEFLDSIKKEQAWRDVAPNVTLFEYLEASRAEERESIVATEPLIEIKQK